MFAIRLIPLSPFLHIERMQNAVGFRTFGALQAMLHTFLLRLSFWRVHVWCAVPPSRMTLSKTFHGLQRFNRRIANDLKSWGEVIRAANIKAD